MRLLCMYVYVDKLMQDLGCGENMFFLVLILTENSSTIVVTNIESS